MSEKELEKVLKALANRRRIAILQYLKRVGTAPVGDIADAIKLSFKATSKHLLILSNADIVEKEQISLSMIYSLAQHTHPLVRQLLSLV